MRIVVEVNQDELHEIVQNGGLARFVAESIENDFSVVGLEEVRDFQPLGFRIIFAEDTVPEFKPCSFYKDYGIHDFNGEAECRWCGAPKE